ncbi:MAG: phosphonate C-P lyase system protein PhnL, partial [Pseudomonadota bacterium]
QPVLAIKSISKTFTLHNQGGVPISVFEGLDLVVGPGECVVLSGQSGAGKSTLMRAIYGNYLSQAGEIRVWDGKDYHDVRALEPRELNRLRKRAMGYVSQFLSVIPRVPTLTLVMEPMLERGEPFEMAQTRARALLDRLNLPEKLWGLPPATFSGGEQQRVNIARGFAVSYPIMLLDEPTASLDAANKQVVIDLIKERLAQGTAIVGILHDQDVRDALNARAFDVAAISLTAA